MAKKEELTKEQVITALRETKGMVYVAAEKLGVSHQTVYNYAKRYKAIQAAIDEQRGKVTDVAELALYRAIQAGEAWAVTFYLKTIGRSRGYVEKQEIQHSWQDSLPEGYDPSEVQRQFVGLLTAAAKGANANGDD